MIISKEVKSRELNKPIKGFETGSQNRLVIDREVLPIIFVPGMMGSRLQNAKGDTIWDPDDRKFMLRNYGLLWAATAKSRKKLLIGRQFETDYLKVSNFDSTHNKVFMDEADPSREKRGWGGVSWSSYGGILKGLQTREWDQSVNLFYEFPVHAFGYNWSASNDLAGEKLAAYINEVMEKYQGRICAKVLLVTHSMGGLVARSACLLHGAKEKVLGVIHGVQPSNGSPASYWRMKGGFERPHTIPDLGFIQWLRNPVKMLNHTKGKLIENGLFGIPFTNLHIGKGNITAWVLGTDGEEVTSLLGNMPGGLQLLPNKQYKNNNGCEQWLELIDKDGNRTALPIADPYREIYRNTQDYYRLVKPEWLSPGSITKSSFRYRCKAALDSYLEYLAEAEHFHDTLAMLEEKVHPETYQFYASGIASSDRVVFTRVEDSLGEKFTHLFAGLKKICRMLSALESRWSSAMSRG